MVSIEVRCTHQPDLHYGMKGRIVAFTRNTDNVESYSYLMAIVVFDNGEISEMSLLSLRAIQ